MGSNPIRSTNIRNMVIFKSWVNQPIGSSKDSVAKNFSNNFSEYVMIEAVRVDVNDVKIIPINLDKNRFPDECWCIFYSNRIN